MEAGRFGVNMALEKIRTNYAKNEFCPFVVYVLRSKYLLPADPC
jgi:hypothetical protein